jgi:hypothetical protein
MVIALMLAPIGENLRPFDATPAWPRDVIAG